MNTSKLRNHERIPDYNPSNTLGLQEREMLMQLFGPQDRLDYPTEILKMANGCEVERYIIPDEDKQKVLDALYPFFDTPSLDADMLDLHTQKTFKVRDYIVTREGNGGYGVIDWQAVMNAVRRIKQDVLLIFEVSGFLKVQPRRELHYEHFFKAAERNIFYLENVAELKKRIDEVSIQ